MSMHTPDTTVDKTEILSCAELAARIAKLEEQVTDTDAEVADDDGQPKMSIIATKGMLDMAYPPLILASTAAAFDYEK